MISRTAAAAALVLALSACGEPNEAEQAVLDLGAAATEGDHEAICESFEPALEQAFVDGDEPDCARVLEEKLSGGSSEESAIEIADSEVDDELGEATVRARNGSGQVRELDLVGDDEGWRISADPRDRESHERQASALLLLEWARG